MNCQLLHRLLARSLQSRFKSQSNPLLGICWWELPGRAVLETTPDSSTSLTVLLCLPRIQDKENTWPHTFTVVPSLLTLSKGYAGLATSCNILIWCIWKYLEFLLLQGSFRAGRYSNQMKFEAKYVFRFSNYKSSQPQSWLHDMCSNTVQQNAKELRWPTSDTCSNWKEAYREKEAVHRHCNGKGTNNGLDMKHNLLFCSQTIAGQKTSVLCLVHSAQMLSFGFE